MTEFYYGLPQEIWEQLCLEAEDLLQEEELGQHLVGIYPAGGRIYGIESYSPGLMCLYVDSVESLIDPTSSYHKESGFKVYSVMNGSSPLYMVDFFKWVRWLTTDQTNDWRMEEFLHVIPFGEHIIHEDDSISGIMSSVRELLKPQGFKLCGDGPIRRNHKKLDYPFIRAYQNLMFTGQFRPCLNSKWDQVMPYPLFYDKEDAWMRNFDKEFISNLMKNEPLPVLEQEYLEIYPCTKRRNLKMVSLIRSQMIEFYRYQL